MARKHAPTLKLEQQAWAEGADTVVGIDEVGKGAWAGPLTLAAVLLPRDRRLRNIRDSKMLPEAERERLYPRILDWCSAVSTGHASVAECDELGMSAAQRLAAQRAIDGLGIAVDLVLVDGTWDFAKGLHGVSATRTQVRGDRVSLSIAAASIVAKVTRDRWMRAAAEDYPAFCFDQNKGYPCPKHVVALEGYGPTAIHRQSWAFMDRLIWRGVVRRPSAVERAALAAQVDQPALF